jgi:hypothetical protein
MILLPAENGQKPRKSRKNGQNREKTGVKREKLEYIQKKTTLF